MYKRKKIVNNLDKVYTDIQERKKQLTKMSDECQKKMNEYNPTSSK